MVANQRGGALDGVGRVVTIIETEQLGNAVEIHYYPGPASVRAIVLYGSYGEARCALVSWYTYHSHGKKLQGITNPTVIGEAAGPTGARLIAFAEREFGRHLREAGPKVVG